MLVLQSQILIQEIKRGSSFNTIPNEVLAFLVELEIGSPQLKEELIDNLINSYKLKRKKWHIVRVVELIEAAIALNVDRNELLKASEKEFVQYDKKSKSYPTLEAMVAKKISELNLKNEDLNHLISAHNLRRKIRVLKIRKITHEVLQNTLKALNEIISNQPVGERKGSSSTV